MDLLHRIFLFCEKCAILTIIKKLWPLKYKKSDTGLKIYSIFLKKVFFELLEILVILVCQWVKKICCLNGLIKQAFCWMVLKYF